MSNEFINGIKVSKLVEPNEQQKAQLYDKFKGQQTEQFELYINYVNEILCILKRYRIVSDFTRFFARVKSTESAIENDGTKALDDVFGMEVDYATPGEQAFVSEIIKSTLNLNKQKIHDKDNGYQARHESGYPVSQSSVVKKFEELVNKKINPEEEYENYCELQTGEIPKNQSENKKKIMRYLEKFKNDFESYTGATKSRMSDTHMQQLKKDLRNAENEYLKKQKALVRASNSFNIPVVEFQSKTIQTAIEANIGSASHEVYKGTSTKKMQKEYDKVKGKVPLSQIPTMYSSNLRTDENGKIKPPKILSREDTLRVLYPGLIILEEGRNGDVR